MKKTMAAMAVSIFVIAGFGCKPSGKYGALKEYMNEVIEANEQYITALEKAGSTKDVEDAMIEHGNRMESLAAKGEKLEKKYPELKLTDSKKLPAELKEEADKLEQTVQKRLTVSMKMMKYMMAPEVMKASQEMGKKMGTLWMLNR